MSKFKPISVKAAEGADPTKEMIDPLDYLILAQLSPEGTMAMGLYPIGTQLGELGTKEPFNQLPNVSNVLSGRVRSMKEWGLTTDIRTLGRKENRSWQITPKGEEVLKEWRKRQS